MTVYTPEEEILNRADADWVLFSEALWLISKWSAMQGLDPRQELVRVFRNLVSRGLVRVGDVRRGEGFVSWQLDEDGTIARVLRAWDALDRVPIPGDVCWIEATPAGKEIAEDLLSHPDPNKTWISDV